MSRNPQTERTSESPNLIFEEHDFRCGYAPRTAFLDREEGDLRLFIGCKDGTVGVVRARFLGRDEEGDARCFRTAGPVGSGVRALARWDGDTLIVARYDGSLGLLRWREEGESGEPIEPAGRVIQQIVRMPGEEARWLLVGEGGLSVLTGSKEVEELRFKRIVGEDGNDLAPPQVPDFRIAVPFAGSGDPGSETWLLIDSDGLIWSWATGSAELVCERQEGRHPGLITDYSLEIADHGGAGRATLARAVYLATDVGVFRVADDFVTRRVHLPAVGPMIVALSYADDGDDRYLSVTDNRGDSHLFWTRLGDRDPKALSFERSGIYHAASEVLQCVLWYDRTSQDLFVGQGRRDDRIVLGRYWVPRAADGDAEPPPVDEARQPTDADLRELLQHGRFEGAEGAEAIARYLERSRIGEAEAEDQQSRSGAEWWLVELFERLAEDPRRRHVLLQSLRSPYAELADRVLEDFVLGDRPVVERPTRIWTLTLLDIIHRVPEGRERAHLRLLRWLRGRQLALKRVEPPAGASDEQKRRVRETVEQIDLDIRFANKWGLHGRVHLDRRDLVYPIDVLRRQRAPLEEAVEKESNEQKRTARNERMRLDLDVLALESLLFLRSASRICDCGAPATRGRTAWQIAVHEESRLIAISWRWGGVELFRFEPPSDPDRGRAVIRPLSRIELSEAAAGDPESPARFVVSPLREGSAGEVIRTKYGYSHVASFVEIGGEPCLFTAPVVADGGHRLVLWRLDPDAPLGLADGPPMELDPGEGVHSILGLGSDHLLLGLRGHAGRPRVAVVALGPFLEGKDREADVLQARFLALPGRASKDPGAQTGGDGTARQGPIHFNRVWSLATVGAEDGRFGVAAGCESGDVLWFEIRPDELADDPIVTTPVDRLRSPVVSLACHRRPEHGVRIFGGCDDGTVMGWQSVPGDGFAQLWATSEKDPVRGMHLLSDLDPPMVLAVTIDGRCVFLNDRFRYEEEVTETDHPRRVNYPGSRHGRPALGTSSYATHVVPRDWWSLPSEVRDLAASAALLHASGDGRLHLTTLHTPSFTEERRKRLEQIARVWRRIVYDLTLVRIGGAVYGSTPVLSLVLVRWLLDPEPGLFAVPGADDGDPLLPKDQAEPGAFFEGWLDDESTRRWFPRYLQPLHDLRRELEAIDSRETVEPSVQNLERRLSAALERTWLLDDLDLFQEICEVVLKRWNWKIFQLGTMGTRTVRRRAPAVAKAYAGIFRAIERMLFRWFGASEGEEARARMLVAKHLVDGETFWQVLRNAAKSDAYQEILRIRRRAVRELVYVRNPLVSLEALRAANLSLLRLCRKLGEARGGADEIGGWLPGSADAEAEPQWQIFRDYFEDLVAAAARTFRSPRQLSDALAHEYSRTFALCVCACPSATLRMASRLTETQVLSKTVDAGSESDLSQRVLRQIQVLRDLEIGVPPWVDDLFRLGSQPPPSDVLDPLEGLEVFEILREAPRNGTRFRFRGREGEEAGEGLPVKLLGGPNGEDLHGLRILYREVVSVFEEMAERLSTDARGIDLSRNTVKRCLDRLGELPESYRDSAELWRGILLSIEPHFLKPRDRVPPEVVLHSRAIAGKCGAWLTRLDDAYRDGRIFQPEHATFHRVIERVRRAAEQFPFSAAVQKNMVEGVLGHHLLEDLDEHAMELEEIAEVLDPLMVWNYRGENKRRMDGLPNPGAATSAQRFARYLLQRAIRAGEIPRNLRILLAMLSSPAARSSRETLFTELYGRCGLKFDLLMEVEGVMKDPPPEIEEREAQYLLLTVDELQQNDRKHGLPTVRKTKARAWFEGDAALLEFFFPGGEGSENYDRLWRQWRGDGAGLQGPSEPLKDRDVASTGTGLYLANLSASVVGWKLSIDAMGRADGPKHPETSYVRFRLARSLQEDEDDEA